MGWIDESERHEGHIKVVFADGRLGGGTWGAGGVTVDGPDGLAARDEAGEYLTRPPSAVIGWRVACDHVPAHLTDENLGRWRHAPEHWLSPHVWHRVYSADEEDLDQHRIYASLNEEWSVDLMGRADSDQQLEDLLVAEWRAHIEPEDHARSVRSALDGLAQARELLDLEVAAAHDAGMSWAEIGRVVGITRQAARDRWSKTLGDDPTRTDD